MCEIFSYLITLLETLNTSKRVNMHISALMIFSIQKNKYSYHNKKKSEQE